MKAYFLIVFAAALLTLNSCVPTRKLTSAQNHVSALQGDSVATHSQLTATNGKLNQCNSDLNIANAKVVQRDSNIVGLQQQNDAMQKQNASMQSQYKNLSEQSQAEISNSKSTIAQQEKRLKELQGLIQSQKDVMNSLKKTVADALVNFKPDELTVSIKDGKLYVSLQEKLLFKSGSDVVDPKGKEALKTLATVLNNNPDISVDIEGHTDSIPIHGKFEDNWALSTARADAIVRILTEEYKVDAHRVIASGRSKFFPVATNETETGRARNRRTEIILSPNLSELFKLLNQ